jgi:hypothetical protein
MEGILRYSRVFTRRQKYVKEAKVCLRT